MTQFRIKELPEQERPMEKLKIRGCGALSDEELLAILIGSGTAKHNALEIAEALLHRSAKRPWLLRSTVHELMELPGIGLTKACRIVAGLALGRRLTERRDFEQIALSNPQSVADYFFSVYQTEERELFCAILVDSKNHPICHEVISVGTLNATLVHAREVFRPAIRAGCNSVILSHNHPSGDPEPSQEDILITGRLAKAGQLLDIQVLDHVVAGRRFVSMKQRGIL